MTLMADSGSGLFGGDQRFPAERVVKIEEGKKTIRLEDGTTVEVESNHVFVDEGNR